MILINISAKVVFMTMKLQGNLYDCYFYFHFRAYIESRGQVLLTITRYLEK